MGVWGVVNYLDYTKSSMCLHAPSHSEPWIWFFIIISYTYTALNILHNFAL